MAAPHCFKSIGQEREGGVRGKHTGTGLSGFCPEGAFCRDLWGGVSGMSVGLGGGVGLGRSPFPGFSQVLGSGRS